MLNEEWFDSLDDTRRKLALWRNDYNNPLGTLLCNALPDSGQTDSSLENQTPTEARRALEQFEGPAIDALAQTDHEECENQTRKLSL